MFCVEYQSPHARTPVQLDGELTFIGNGGGLRNLSWAYELGYREAYSIRRVAREEQFTLSTKAELAQEFRRVTEADTAAGTPGEFIVYGEYRQRALIVAEVPENVFAGEVSVTITALLLDGAWWRIASREFVPIVDDPSTYEFLDFDFDFPIDLGRPRVISRVESATLTPSPIYLTIYGPATNPYVIVGGNRYQVNASIPAGAHLTIDGKYNTIELTSTTGTVTNLFDAGLRGSGEGGGEYIFEQLPPGEQGVSWDNSFGFALGWYEQTGAPPWQK